MASQKPTSHDVARLAGVSQTTVSYVMSGRRAVAPDTEQRVLRAMSELGYQPNSGARALRSKKTNVIGTVIPYHPGADPGAQHQFIIALTTEARKYDYDILLVTADEGAPGLRRVIDGALCDGLLIMEVATRDPRTEVIHQSGTPAVFIGIPENEDPILAIDSDYESAARQSVELLRERGHRRISLLVPHDESLTELNFISRFRKEARACANSLGISLLEHQVDVSYRHVARYLSRLAPVAGDALLLAPVVSADDWCNALRDRGLIPGRDISLIASSWDEDRAHTPDRPTCFDMRTQELTERAIQLLITRISSRPPDRPMRHLIEPRLRMGTTVMAAH